MYKLVRKLAVLDKDYLSGIKKDIRLILLKNVSRAYGHIGLKIEENVWNWRKSN